jgi:hypothetical protein
MQQLSPSQAQFVQALAAKSKPTALCFYGDDDAIRVVGNLSSFGLNVLALPMLLELVQRGWSKDPVEETRP